MANRKILITGGAGFIGSKLAKRLSSAGDDVLCFDCLHPQVHGADAIASRKAFEKGGMQLCVGRIENAPEIAACIAGFGPDVVYHLAAETGTGQSYDEPTRYNLANVIGTTNLIEAIRRLPKAPKRVVLASSRSVYGEGAGALPDGTICNAEPRSPDDLKRGDFSIKSRNGVVVRPVPTPAWLPPMPASIYASTKLMQEYLLQQGLAGGGTDVAVLRLQNVYGPGQSLSNPYTGVISIFSQLIKKGVKLNIFEDGEIVRDFVFVGDVVRAFDLAGRSARISRTPVNIGSGEQTSIRAMAMTLLAMLGRDPADHYVSGDFRIGDVRFAVAETSVAADLLGWHAETAFAKGLEQFAVWSKAD